MLETVSQLTNIHWTQDLAKCFLACNWIVQLNILSIPPCTGLSHLHFDLYFVSTCVPHHNYVGLGSQTFWEEGTQLEWWSALNWDLRDVAWRSSHEAYSYKLKETSSNFSCEVKFIKIHIGYSKNIVWFFLLLLQLEDLEYSTASAVKAKKTMELELADLQQQLDELFKSKQEVPCSKFIIIMYLVNIGIYIVTEI